MTGMEKRKKDAWRQRATTTVTMIKTERLEKNGRKENKKNVIKIEQRRK